MILRFTLRTVVKICFTSAAGSGSGAASSSSCSSSSRSGGKNRSGASKSMAMGPVAMFSSFSSSGVGGSFFFLPGRSPNHFGSRAKILTKNIN